MKKYYKLLRIKHWFKNFLIFLPLFFGGELLNIDLFSLTILSFFAFSVMTSFVYIINDIRDIESDKIHPIKKKRPLASGLISIRKAYLILFLLLIIYVIIGVIIFNQTNNLYVFLVPIIYLVINLLYSFKLKNIPIVDVSIIAIGFILRLMYGGIISGIKVSKWLYLILIFGSFYLGFGKRRNEIIQNGTKSRKVLEHYNKDFLDKNMYVNLTLALMSYVLWSIDGEVVERIGTNQLFWTVPILLMIFQIYSLNIEKDNHGDPIEIIFGDKVLLLLILIYMIIMTYFIYI